MEEREPEYIPFESGAAVSFDRNKGRYMVFMGNLPYTATKEDIQTFFADLEVTSIRLLTDKQTGKPRGFAFVEFPDSVNLASALDLHQKTLKGRKVNIELTAGGGGNKSKVRKERIKTKNEKLQAERSSTPQTINEDRKRKFQK